VDLILASKKARLRAPDCLSKTGGMHWAALQAAHQKLLQNSFNLVVVDLYNEARTHFQRSM
jgi:hypothetical protein